MSLKILHVLDHSVPLHSGYAFRTLAILREQRKLGWQTLQVTTPRQGVSAAACEEFDGFFFHRSDAVEGGRLFAEMRSTARAVDEAVRKFQPDIVHAHSPVLAGLPAWRVARRHGCRFVYEIRALWEDAAVDHGSSASTGIRYSLSRALETFLLRRADHVTCICEGLRQEIISRGVETERVTVIPNAVDVDRFAPAGETEASRNQEDTGKVFRVGFIGSFYRYEGLDILLEATAQLKKKNVQIEVLMVGGGPEADTLKLLSESLDLTETVSFTGRVDNAEVAAHYRELDALVYPRRSSRLTEMVTPLKPLEAMANHKLVLATDIGGHRELIEHGETGLLCKPDDSRALADLIKQASADPDLCRRITANGPVFVRDHRNWTASVARYQGVYEG